MRASTLLAAMAFLASWGKMPACAAVPAYTAEIVKTFPHDPKAFTEGLEYHDGLLYESTGLEGQSDIRRVRIETGEILQRQALDPKYFGEGIVIWRDRIVSLTYTTQIGFVYDLKTFAPLSSFTYPGEGWGMTQDGTNLIMSDGTSSLRLLDPETRAERRRIPVTCNGRPVRNLNELEWVGGEIYANVWQTALIVRINPKTGAVVGVIDVSALARQSGAGVTADVPNGIAYDAAGDRLFVTGKFWPTLYQIRLAPIAVQGDVCTLFN